MDVDEDNMHDEYVRQMEMKSDGMPVNEPRNVREARGNAEMDVEREYLNDNRDEDSDDITEDFRDAVSGEDEDILDEDTATLRNNDVLRPDDVIGSNDLDPDEPKKTRSVE